MKLKKIIIREKNLQKSLTFDHNFDAPYLNLGTMYEQQGDDNRAKEMYKKAYELDNTLDEAKNMIDKLGIDNG